MSPRKERSRATPLLHYGTLYDGFRDLGIEVEIATTRIRTKNLCIRLLDLHQIQIVVMCDKQEIQPLLFHSFSHEIE